MLMSASTNVNACAAGMLEAVILGRKESVARQSNLMFACCAASRDSQKFLSRPVASACRYGRASLWACSKRACLPNTRRHARLGWISRLAIRPRQRACDTASGSGEDARSRATIVSGWRSSAAPAFRALVGWRSRVEGIWAFARAAATNEEDATNHAACIHGRRRLHQ